MGASKTKHLSAPLEIRLRRKAARQRRNAPEAQARAERRVQRMRDRWGAPSWLEGFPFGARYSSAPAWGAPGSGSRFGRMKRKGERIRRAKLERLGIAPKRKGPKLIVTAKEVEHTARREGALRASIRNIGRGIRELGRKLGARGA